MNDASVAEQTQIFEASLEASELEALNALVARHKADAALTQQLALDASKLVATSQERLARQADAGFLRRMANAMSGKTSENQLQNQNDALQMQRFAWHYLQQLQQQNLLSSQCIAVIRNNLGTMNGYLIETRDFLERAVDRIDERLQHVEKNTSFNNWALDIEASKRRWKSHPQTLLIVRLTFDFMRSHPGVLLSERDVNNYLLNTLEKLDINCDEEVELVDFVVDLIDQIELQGIDQFRKVIEVRTGEHLVDSHFIQKNISGTGFNALYFLADHYNQIVGLTSNKVLNHSDDAREEIVATFFGSEFSSLTTKYRIRHLIYEIIGGLQLAVDVFKSVHGLDAVAEEIAQAPQQQEPVELVSSLPDIHAHTFFDGNHNEESKRNYLLLLALCVDTSASFNRPALEFVAHLADKAGQPSIEANLLKLADNPRKLTECQPALSSLLNDDDKKYTWLLDAFFLLTLAQKPIESSQVKALLSILKPAQLKELLPTLMALVAESDSSRVLEEALKLAPVSHGWKNLVRYRKLRFDGYFEEVKKRFHAVDSARWPLEWALGDVHAKAREHAWFISFSDGSLMDSLTDKAAALVCSQGRKSALAGLNECRKKVRDFLSEHRSALRQADYLASRWNIPSFEFEDEISYSDYELDNSAENEDWNEHFERYYNEVRNALDSFNDACSDASEQIGLFSAGDFDQSVHAIKAQRRADNLKRQQQEKLEKQSVPLMKDGTEYRFSIDWQRVDNPPCDPTKISHIKTDGKVWLIVARINSDDRFYRSEDGMHWHEVQVDTPDFKVSLKSIMVVNGTWIIKNHELRGGRESGVYFSCDARAWQFSPGPAMVDYCKVGLNKARVSHDDIVHFKGVWLWIASYYQDYSYIEKGIFTDSTKTDSYRKTVVLAAESLDGPWQQWEHSPQFTEGVQVKKICALPGESSLLAFCEYDSSYIRNKKKPDTPPFVMYFGAAKLWQTCGWEGSRSFYSSDEPIFLQQGGKLMYFSSREVLTSPKGYDWSLQDTRFNVENHVDLGCANLFTATSSSTVRLTQDGKEFKEIELDDGVWRHIIAKESGMLGVYYANKHEETILRLGRFIWQANE